MTSKHGLFAWYTLWSTHPDKTIGFFKELVGWEAKEVAMGGYGKSTYLVAGGITFGDISKAQPGLGIPARWTAFVIVDDVNAAVAKVKELGGKVQRPAFNMPGVGRMAIVTDPVGAMICLITPEKPEAMSSMGTQEGQVSWNELLCTEPEKAIPFYETVFGWKFKAEDMGPMGTYHMFASADGKNLGGIMKTPAHAQGYPAQWLTYVNVPNVADKTALAEKLGATVKLRFEIPNTGLVTFLTEPGGSDLYLFENRH